MNTNITYTIRHRQITSFYTTTQQPHRYAFPSIAVEVHNSALAYADFRIKIKL